MGASHSTLTPSGSSLTGPDTGVAKATPAQAAKKMSLMQLTFIVAVNMMGSGIIMLPTNMAKVGAISLLSWIVTALGSMAIAYGFAQAGLFNQRSGGMSAYAEDAYGKPGYFNVFYLYFLSLAIGNVAIAISAVGYLATFFPWLAATPIATTVGVIGLIWVTTFANFGGPSVTGKIGSITVWGVININVPPDWTDDLNGTPVMGGFAEKTPRPPDASKRLVITAYAIMGGVEVRN